MFQDFYVKAESHIATHISALSTRQSRGSSPNPSISSKGSGMTKDGNRLRSSSSKDTLGSINTGPEQQMLTPQEISDRRKARRLLNRKRIALEEAVERRVCEQIYNRIWRHRSTLDEVRDEKLRSRTAALALVGIGLKDLGISFDASSSPVEDPRVEDWISKARDGLLRMSDAKYPLGKLQQLAAAHKNIVDLLTDLHQSSSSADEILPTLIYTLITSPPEGINVISNLHFIQRFRAANKVDGEAAYCLVNFEAAITFLETVDLASLRSDELPEGPPKTSSRPATPHDETHLDPLQEMPILGSSKKPSRNSSSMSSHPLFEGLSESPSLPMPSEPSSPAHQRKLSNLFQPPVSAFGAAGDAVRTTADQGIKTIGNTLDSSFNLLFGRLREHKVTGDGSDPNRTILVPKTLEDARKLVEPKPEEDDDNSTTSTPLASNSDEPNSTAAKSDDSLLLSAFAGRKPQPRDRSVDSAQSSGSGNRRTVLFASSSEKRENNSPSKTTQSNQSPSPSPSGNAAVDSIVNFGNTLNPLKGFSGFGVRGFGRANSSPSSAATPAMPASAASSSINPATTNTAEDKKSREPKEMLKSLSPVPKIQPPSQRFMDLTDAEDLRIGEVAELLKDYKRLAGALKDMNVFS